MKLGLIKETSLEGRKVILEPRNDLPKNIYLVEKGKFFNGSEQFAHYCLVCEKQVPVGSWCDKCNKEE